MLRSMGTTDLDWFLTFGWLRKHSPYMKSVNLWTYPSATAVTDVSVRWTEDLSVQGSHSGCFPPPQSLPEKKRKNTTTKRCACKKKSSWVFFKKGKGNIRFSIMNMSFIWRLSKLSEHYQNCLKALIFKKYLVMLFSSWKQRSVRNASQATLSA